MAEKIDYNVTYSNNINIGIANVKIVGLNYYEGIKTVIFEIVNATDSSAESDSDTEIEKIDINDTSISVNIAKTQYEYTGEAIEPTITVKRYSVGQLKEGTDYNLSYNNNIEIGDAQVIVEGINGYQGYRYIPFKIVEKEKAAEKEPEEEKETDDSRDASSTDKTKFTYDTNYASSTDTVTITQQGGYYTIGDISGNEAEVTIAKGNKVKVPEGSGFESANKKNVKVSKEGLIKAKKASTGNIITYIDADGEKITLTVNVIDPKADNGKKLTAKVALDSSFDIPLTVPLNAEFATGQGGGIVSDVTAEVESDMKLHVKGDAVKKGTAKIIFTVNDKRFKLKIKVK